MCTLTTCGNRRMTTGMNPSSLKRAIICIDFHSASNFYCCSFSTLLKSGSGIKDRKNLSRNICAMRCAPLHTFPIFLLSSFRYDNLFVNTVEPVLDLLLATQSVRDESYRN